MSSTGDGDALDCPECGAVCSLKRDVCEVCYAEVGERDATLGFTPALFWDLASDEFLFESASPVGD